MDRQHQLAAVCAQAGSAVTSAVPRRDVRRSHPGSPPVEYGVMMRVPSRRLTLFRRTQRPSRGRARSFASSGRVPLGAAATAGSGDGAAPGGRRETANNFTFSTDPCLGGGALLSRDETGSDDACGPLDARLEIASIRAINESHGGEGTGHAPSLAGLHCRARWIVAADPHTRLVAGPRR
jgi:hypothetical protein